MSIRNRNWVFTLNNYTEEEYNNIIATPCRYQVVGKEVGENGTPHQQGYIEFENARTMLGIKRLFKTTRVHLETRKGTPLEATNYCKKDGDFIEIGKMSNQGARTDIYSAAQAIIKNELTAEELLLENPQLYSRTRNTINDLEQIRLRQLKRTEKTECIWYFGKTGCGKSHTAFEIANAAEDYYVYADDGKWWDDYTGQEVTIIDDFRGSIPYNQLLKLADKWETLVPRRGKAPIPFVSKKIIITSVLHPEEVYHNLSMNDSLKQQYRRIKLVYICNQCRKHWHISCERCTEVQQGNTSACCTCAETPYQTNGMFKRNRLYCCDIKNED